MNDYTLFVEGTEICQKRVILVFSIILYTKTQRIQVKLNSLKHLIDVFFENKTILIENFVYWSYFPLLCFKTLKLMKTSQYSEAKVKVRKNVLF